MVFNAYHNSQELFYREPFGAVRCGQRITIRLQTWAPVPVEACILRLWETERETLITMAEIREETSETDVRSEPYVSQEAQLADQQLFAAEYEVPHSPGLIWYFFEIRSGSETYYYGNNVNRLGGEGQLWDHEPPSYQITVHKQMEVPKWYKQGIMYQLFVDRFYGDHAHSPAIYPRKNALMHANWFDPPIYIKDEQGRVTDWDFFGGNLQGVLAKLPYFRELGISILYFNPIFAAASNHKYDTADYHQIDPMYGDEQIFAHLIEAAGQLGIAIILDGVFSHTGSDSLYFNKDGTYPTLGAYQSPDSPYYTWYKFKGEGEEYQSWWGVDSLPEVNELDLSYRQFIYGSEDSVIQKWLQMGIAGWRLDVADELPDEFIQELRKALKTSAPEAVLIGEVWEDASNKVSYGKLRAYFSGDELDATMNYPLRSGLLSFILDQSEAKTLHQQVMSLYENYPRENFMAAMNLLGSHDTARILTLLGEAPALQNLSVTAQRTFRLSDPDRHLALQRLKLLSLVQITFPGVPCIYYGDEVGLEGYPDPYNRGTYPWGKEDLEILEWYRRILRMHAEYEVLQTGDFKPFYFQPDIYGFRRIGKDEEIVILINRHQHERKTVNLMPLLSATGLIIDLINGERLVVETLSALSLEPLTGKALYCRKKLPAPRQLSRSAGVLLHISSLPSAWGLGDLGPEAYDFVDFLADSGQSLWQVLPLNPPGEGDCPYQSESVFAGNSLFISLDLLIREGLLGLDETLQDYAKLRSFKLRRSLLHQANKELKRELLQKAYEQFLLQMESKSRESSGSADSTYLSPQNYLEFQVQNKDWLDDYVLFRAVKAHFGELPWYEWESGISSRQAETLAKYSLLLQKEMGFERFVQYTFFFQWQALKGYCQTKGVQVIGDIPYFVAADSCDVWVNRALFLLDAQGRPAKTAGVPPDYFSKTGQLWRNPVYNWKALAATHFAWWKKRIRLGLASFDYTRLDHFRGFEAYWEVDAASDTAEKGRWIKGPGKRLFESFAETFGDCPFIVEDLGVITPEVNNLKQIFAFPGIKVLQFTPLEELSLSNETNLVYYTGTHDNNTLLGWYEKTNFPDNEDSADNDLKRKIVSKQACRDLINDLYRSRAAWIILPMQDILGLGEEARMNIPGTVRGNWQWRLEKSLLTAELKSWLKAQAESTTRKG